MDRRKFVAGMAALAGLAAAGSLAAACSDSDDDGPESSGSGESRSSALRLKPSAADLEPARQVASANAEFGWELYRILREGTDGNLFFSPYSIGVAMAMAYAGARGDTSAELARALHYEGLDDELHPGFNALDAALKESPEVKDGQAFTLSPANSAWVQAGYPFHAAYLDLLAQYYGSGAWTVDFAAEPEAARARINDWVEDQTNDRIQDLLPPGTVDNLTRLVLANAVYFKADWLFPFEPEATSPGPFRRGESETIEVPMMHRTGSFPHAVVPGPAGGEVAAAELPYAGQTVSMLILVPELGQLAKLEDNLAATIDAVVPALQSGNLPLTMPRWEFSSEFGLIDAFKGLGVSLAFDKDQADFSAIAPIDGGRRLYISAIQHKAFVKVDEEGTEAVAATGVVETNTSAPAFKLDVDRPFVFVIRHNETGAILFAGRVTDPSA